MATPQRNFLNGQIYHVVNRGVDGRRIFMDAIDASHLLKTLAYYQQQLRSTRLSLSNFELADRGPQLRFLIIAQCVMPNHIHWIIKQLDDSGIRLGMSDIFNSYTRYFNTRHKRVGHLFQGTFRAVPIESDEQLVHTVRYAFINPVVAGLSDDPGSYHWSSYSEVIQKPKISLTDPSDFCAYFSDTDQLQSFVLDQIDYGRSLESIKHLTLE